MKAARFGITIFSIPIIGMLSVCGGKSDELTLSELQQDYRTSDVIARAKASILDRLRDPDSAQFSDMVAIKNGRDIIVCGIVNAKNGFGGYAGRAPFLYSDGLRLSKMPDGFYSASAIAEACQDAAEYAAGVRKPIKGKAGRNQEG